MEGRLGRRGSVFWASLTLFRVVGVRERGEQIIWGSCMSINEGKSCFSYLSHSGMGMSQLDHHREARRCELKEIRGIHSLSSQSMSPKAPACSVERLSHLI